MPRRWVRSAARSKVKAKAIFGRMSSLSATDAMSTTGATHVHLAFQAPDRATVDRFYAAAIAAGGKDHGKPGVREQYHAGYYAAFVIDPDGNNLEAVYHGPAKRSADSVVVSF